MKKIVLVLVTGLLVGTAAFADHEGFGIGIVGGGYGGWGGGFGYPGLSLKIPGVPVFWGIYFPIHYRDFNFGLTGDYYIIDKNIVGKGETKLDWYLGLGGFVHLFFWHYYNHRYESIDDFNIDFGLRIPIGLSLHIIKQLELFGGFHPGLGIWIGDYERHDRFPVFFYIGGEIGLRLWF